MKTRLWKEFRILALAWVVAVIVAPMAEYGFFHKMDELFYMFVIQVFACFVMGSQAFGTEFTLGTMERLLSQPVGRERIWREKMLVLGLLVFSSFIVMCIAFLLLQYKIFSEPLPPPWMRIDPDFASFFRSNLDKWFALAVVFGLAYLSAVCGGPLMSLYLRQSHTAFWASIIIPVIIVLLFHEMIPSNFVNQNIFNFLFEIVFNPLSLWCIISYILARRKFMRLEV